MKKNIGVLFTILTACLASCDLPSSSSSEEEISSMEESIEYNLLTHEIEYLRDVCVLPDPVSKKYYMIGFQQAPGIGSDQDIPCYESLDLQHWGNRTIAMHNNGRFEQTWAPELHMYKGGYYLFGNLQYFTSDNSDIRGCYILKADKPNGEYEIYSERITPENWQCLDGTLYVEDDVPYMIYCREWVRMPDGNGEMYAVKLKDDLSGPAEGAEHVKLFAAKDHPASTDGVTDAPFMYKAKNGDLVMLWSKYVNGNYAIISSRSKSGKIAGPWTHDAIPLSITNVGHAMVFTDFDGNTRIAFHYNDAPNHPFISYLDDDNGVLSIRDNN